MHCGLRECSLVGSMMACRTLLHLRFGFPFTASRQISELDRVQYPNFMCGSMSSRNMSIWPAWAFTQQNPQVLYLKPHARITQKASSSVGQVAHRNNTQLEAASSPTGSAATCSVRITS